MELKAPLLRMLMKRKDLRAQGTSALHADEKEGSSSAYAGIAGPLLMG